MLKILIADDEPKVCKLITKLIEDSGMDCQVAGIVHDGVSALEFLKEQEVDLLVTDIRMLGYTGLELIESIRKVHNNIRVIIISGYGQFDYAQKAIKCGVDDYLLKPLKGVELNSALKKIIAQKEKRQEQEEERNNMIERIAKREKGEVFRRYLERPMDFGKQEREEIFESMFENSGGGICQAVIVRILFPHEKIYGGSKQRQAMINALEIVRKNLQKDGRAVLATVKDVDIYCVISGNEEILDKGVEYLRKIKIDITKLSEVYSGLKAYVAVGKRVYSPDEIINSTNSAEEVLLGRFLTRSPEILTAYKKMEESTGRDFDWAKKKELFLNSMEVLDVEEIQTMLSDLQKQVSSCQNLTGIQVKQLYGNIVTTFRFGLHRFGIELPNKKDDYSLERKFEYFCSIEEIFEELHRYIVDGLLEWENLKNANSGEKKHILKAKQYINKYYYMPLTLEEVSDYVGFNASYFSSVFKKEMNQSFSEYLTEIRIRYAKQILLNEDIGITEVSERVGYNDKKYFAKVFKKNTGLTPYEYKKIYQ